MRPHHQILPLTSVELPVAKPLSAPTGWLGRKAAVSRSSPIPVRAALSECTLRSDNIRASSETDLRLALGPGILQLASLLHKALLGNMFAPQIRTFPLHFNFAKNVSPLCFPPPSSLLSPALLRALGKALFHAKYASNHC